MQKSIVTAILLVIAFLLVMKVKSFIRNNQPQTTPPPPVVVATSTVTSKATLGLNDTFESNGIIIKPWAVLEDNRCPSDVQCIQAGRAVVALSVGSSTVDLMAGETKILENLSITLDDVTPHPVSTHKIADSEYRFVITLKMN